jgi:hypothetical protein
LGFVLGLLVEEGAVVADGAGRPVGCVAGAVTLFLSTSTFGLTLAVPPAGDPVVGVVPPAAGRPVGVGVGVTPGRPVGVAVAAGPATPVATGGAALAFVAAGCAAGWPAGCAAAGCPAGCAAAGELWCAGPWRRGPPAGLSAGSPVVIVHPTATIEPKPRAIIHDFFMSALLCAVLRQRPLMRCVRLAGTRDPP